MKLLTTVLTVSNGNSLSELFILLSICADAYNKRAYNKTKVCFFILLFTFTAVVRSALGATHSTVHLRLIGKHVVDFLLVIIELFFTKCYG